MAKGVFVFDVLATLILSGTLSWNYGSWMKHHILVTLAVLIAWYFSFMIVFVIPLDVSSTAFRQCVNASFQKWQNNESLQNASYNQLHFKNVTIHSSLSGVTAVNLLVTEQDIKKIREAPGSTNENPPTIGDIVTKNNFNNGTDWADRLNLDVNADIRANNDCQPPYSILDDGVLTSLWRVVYWSSQFLTWLILPLMQSFSQAGEFTVYGKLKSSLWDNAIFYSSYLLIALILIIYVAVQPSLHLTWDRTTAIAAAASNTWGLFVLVLLLGYGLVEVPRNLWNRSHRGYQLRYAHFKLAKLMSEKSDAEEHLEDVLVVVQLLSTEIGVSDSLRPQVDTILKRIPVEMMEKVKRRRTAGDVNDFGSDLPTEKTLIKLNRQVIRALQTQQRTEAQWSDWMDHAFEVEDINKNMVSNEHRFVHDSSEPPSSSIIGYIYTPKIEWYWKCLLRPLLLRISAVLAVIMSILIIWSEITFFSIRPTLSVFAAIISSAAKSHSYLLIELVCLITIFYICLCTYYTVFKIRVLDYFYLATNHQSDEYTLLFSGALFCRITPALCLNFLSIIHMDSHVIQSQIMETAYTRIMGHMDVVSIVSDYFNIYFPIALLALTMATYFSLGARVLSALGFQQFLTQDSELTQELVEEGKEHMKREKRRRQRLAETASRRREFSDRFGIGEQLEGSASSPNVRQRTPIAKNLPSHEESLRGGTLVSSNYEGLLNTENSHTVELSPRRSLLGSSHDFQRSDSIDPFLESQDSNSFRFQKGKNPPTNIFDDL